MANKQAILEEIYAFITNYLKEEFELFILSKTEREEDKFYDEINKFYKKYYGKGVRSTVVYPFSPSDDWFQKEEEIRRHHQVRALFVIRQFKEQQFYDAYTSHSFIGSNSYGIRMIIKRIDNQFKIVSKYSFNIMENSWRHTSGLELNLSKFETLALKKILAPEEERSLKNYHLIT